MKGAGILARHGGQGMADFSNECLHV
jgi:hypothetical protein